MKSLLIGSICAVGLLAAPQSPDNTKVNKDQGKVTADQQSNSERDVDITKQIRREITKLDSMSTYAKNVKIITKNGAVTLRGPVRSAEEKGEIEQIAKRIVGEAKVTNDLEIKQ